MKTVTVKIEDGLLLDLLLHRLYGVRGRTLVEATLDLNQDLETAGLYLPAGTQVQIPDLPAETATRQNVPSLFD
ncbi:MAG: tail protein X [Nitratireductor sp.]|nr:tail protein X [Nitratireductor sp.]